MATKETIEKYLDWVKSKQEDFNLLYDECVYNEALLEILLDPTPEQDQNLLLNNLYRSLNKMKERLDTLV